MTIRKANLSDSDDIARLTGELGYAGDSDVIRDRLEQIASQPDQVVFVAVVEERIVGWVQYREDSNSLSESYAKSAEPTSAGKSRRASQLIIL
jgi:hypothetical protein